MRPTALIPILCCIAALILSFLCLFAGHKQNFMEDYHLLTLNTSRLGENLLNSSNPTGVSSLDNLLNLIPDNIKNDIDSEIGAVTEKLGIEDFYSAHILDYCYGQFTPAEAPNATLSSSDIHKNVTGCSNQTAMYAFNPTKILEDALNKSGVGITLNDLEWPDDIQRGIDALRIVSIATFVLYCIAIGTMFLGLIAAAAAIFSAGRLAACLNLMLAILAFLSIGIASALVTAVIVKGSDLINQHGQKIGIEAHAGGKFLALTWAATALMLITLCWWSFETCCGHRRKTTAYTPKHG